MDIFFFGTLRFAFKRSYSAAEEMELKELKGYTQLVFKRYTPKDRKQNGNI